MRILGLLHREDPERRGFFWTMVGLFVLFTAVNLLILSHAVHATLLGSLPTDLLILSLLALAVATLARHATMLRTIVLLEGVVLRERLRFLDGLARADLPTLETTYRPGQLVGLLSSASRAVSEIGGTLLRSLTMTGRLLAVLFALLWLSPALFLALTLALAGLGVVWTLSRLTPEALVNEHDSAGNAAGSTGAAAPDCAGSSSVPTSEAGSENSHEAEILAAEEQLLLGFKEIKLNRSKGDAFLSEELRPEQVTERESRRAAGQRLAVQYVATETGLIALGGALIYLAPLLFPGQQELAIKAAFIAITLPTTILRDAERFLATNRALLALDDLDAAFARVPRHESAGAAGAGVTRDPPRAEAPHDAPEWPARDTAVDAPGFQALTLDRVLFHYFDADGRPTFTVGPISYTFRKGAIHFITGDNGSGKSTLLHLIAGLYPPQGGQITVNGTSVEPYAQRSLFAAVFSEAHVLPRLYGAAAHAVNPWLERLNLSEYTRYDPDSGWTRRTTLSSGQRKRLALACALVDERPILLLDEWAADQDPDARRWFYREFIPYLKSEGRTLIAISHDHRYFDAADVELRIAKGKLILPAQAHVES